MAKIRRNFNNGVSLFFPLPLRGEGVLFSRLNLAGAVVKRHGQYNSPYYFFKAMGLLGLQLKSRRKNALKVPKQKLNSEIAPLSSEAAATLKAQAAVLTAACEAGRDLEALKKLVTVNPEDRPGTSTLWGPWEILSTRRSHRSWPSSLGSP